jgi:indole-3-glycerol phosphate synthase
MSDFLDEMTRVGLRRAAEVRPTLADLERRAKSAPPPLPLEVAGPGFDVIAEAKLSSPSEGQLVAGDDESDAVVSLARAYAESGAAAISILTEETRFTGSLAHLEAVAGSCPAPVMRKDFLVAPVQVLEARAHGASGVLLIARMLTRSLLEEMTDLALAHGMFVVVEVFERADLDAAAHVFDREVLVGVNSRDLATLEVDPGRFATVASHLPDHLPAVAESGLASVEDIVGVVSLGYRLALIGSSLVTDPRPGARLRCLIAAGRAALTRASS